MGFLDEFTKIRLPFDDPLADLDPIRVNVQRRPVPQTDPGLFGAITDVLGTVGKIATRAIPAIFDFKALEAQREMARSGGGQQMGTLAPFQTQAGLVQSLGGLGAIGQVVRGVGRQLPGIVGGVAVSEALQGGSQVNGDATRLMVPFRPTMAGARAQPFVAQNPVTGSLTWFKPAGRPILWSGDLTAAKRVKRIAARARRSSR